VNTKNASSVTESSAILNGQVWPNGSPTSAYFQLGRDTHYGVSSPPESVGGGNGNVNYSTMTSGLGCGTYHFRVVAQNTAGTSFGDDMTFVTVACPRGDENGDTLVNVQDVFYLVNHLFSGGPGPAYEPGSDANSDNELSVQDVFFLLNFLFSGGPPSAP